MSQTTTQEKVKVTVNQYFQYLSQEKLMGTKCPKCQHIDLPAKTLCSQCFHETEWTQLQGEGKLSTFTSIYVGNKVMVSKGYDKNKPYIFAIATMKEGPMVSGQLMGVNETKPEEIKLGLPIKVIYIKSEIGKDKENKPIFRTDIGFSPK